MGRVSLLSVEDKVQGTRDRKDNKRQTQSEQWQFIYGSGWMDTRSARRIGFFLSVSYYVALHASSPFDEVPVTHFVLRFWLLASGVSYSVSFSRCEFSGVALPSFEAG